MQIWFKIRILYICAEMFLCQENMRKGKLRLCGEENIFVFPTPSTPARESNEIYGNDIYHPKLKEHLAAVTALMRAAANWDSFKRNLQRAFPKFGENVPLPLDD